MCYGSLVLLFVISGLSFTTEDTVADLGPVEVEEQDQTTIPTTPVTSGVVLLVGAGLDYAGRRRSKK